jgi:hypothetical protein
MEANQKEKIIEEALNSLHQEAKDFVLRFEWQNTVTSIAKGNNLSESQRVSLEDEVLYILLKIEPASNFPQNIKESVDISDGVVNEIVLEVENKIFKNIRDIFNRNLHQPSTPAETDEYHNSLDREDILTQIEDKEPVMEESLALENIIKEPTPIPVITPEIPQIPIIPPPAPVVEEPVKTRVEDVPINLPIGEFNENGSVSPMDQKLIMGVVSNKEEVLISDKINNIPTHREYSIDPYKEIIE